MHEELKSIKTLRKRIGLTQSGLAKRANVSQSLVAKIESGKLDPTFSKAKLLLETLKKASSKSTTTAKDIMQTKIIHANIKDKVNKVIEKMRKHEISQMPVIDKYVVGLVSESSILSKASSGKSLKDMTAEDVMAEAAPMVPENTSTETVSNMLKQHQMVIVSKHGELTGVITKADILKNIYKV